MLTLNRTLLLGGAELFSWESRHLLGGADPCCCWYSIGTAWRGAIDALQEMAPRQTDVWPLLARAVAVVS